MSFSSRGHIRNSRKLISCDPLWQMTAISIVPNAVMALWRYRSQDVLDLAENGLHSRSYWQIMVVCHQSANLEENHKPLMSWRKGHCPRQNESVIRKAHRYSMTPKMYILFLFCRALLRLSFLGSFVYFIYPFSRVTSLALRQTCNFQGVE